MTFNSKKFAIASAALACVLSLGHAQAALTSADYATGSGDNWITRDSESGLDWLDLTLTINQNFDAVRSGSWYAQGFRYATRAEVETLFVHAGVVDGPSAFDPAQVERTISLANMLGPTLEGVKRLHAVGLTGSTFSGGTVTLESHPIGTRFNALLAKVDYVSFSGGTLGSGNFGGGHPFSDEASPNYGSFLIRATAPVPEPSGWILAAMGMLTLGAVARRKRGH